MSGMLEGMRVVEGAAFVAAPLGAMTLAQLGADVIRFDPIGGGIDHRRWPVTDDGVSLYWAGLNKGKRSIALDLSSDEGRDLAAALITAPGPDGGIFLTNYPESSWLDIDDLRRRRPDLIVCHVVGNPDGSTAVDYTVHAATGYPLVTGPADFDGAVNSVVPTWDLIAGMTAATAILAAERHRTRTGAGRLIRIPLSDVAFAVLGHLGHIAEVQVLDRDRPGYGNHLFGAFGRDFTTADGERVMVVAITPRQFRGLAEATEINDELTGIEESLGRPLVSDGDLFEAREAIAAALEPWFASVSLADAGRRLDEHRVLWGPYRSFRDLVEQDPRVSTANPMFADIDQPQIGRYLTPASPIGPDRLPPLRAPVLGEHTDEILTGVLGMSPSEVGSLHDRGVVAGV